MKKYVNGQYIELTAEEEQSILDGQAKADAEYWQNISYEDAVNAEIRKKYTESQEFAILRQKDEKPAEYAEYYAYCEWCKGYVKEKKEHFLTEVNHDE